MVAEHHRISNFSCVLLPPSVLTFSVLFSPHFFRDEVKMLFDICQNCNSNLIGTFFQLIITVIQVILCHETNLVSRTSFFSYMEWLRRSVVFTLSLSHIGGEMPWGRDCHQLYEVFTKQALHKVWYFLVY